VQLKIPLSWRANDANASHIVQKWTTDVDSSGSVAMLMISVYPLTAKELPEVQASFGTEDPVAFAKGSLPPGATFVSARRIALLQKPAFEIAYRMTSSQLDQSFETTAIMYQSIARGGVVQIAGSVVSPVGAADQGKLFGRYRDVFKLVANSLTDISSVK
jgi:hypothetical protein